MSSTEGTNLSQTINDYVGANRTLFNILPLTDAIFAALKAWEEKIEARVAIVEAAAGTGGGGGSTTFTDPSSLTGLAVWLDASYGAGITLVSGAVSQWNDRSGNGVHFAQSTAGQRPTVASAAINGKNAILFDGSNDFLVNSSANFAARTLFVVGKYSDSAPNQYAGLLTCRVSAGATKGGASDTNIVLGTAGTSNKVAGSGSASAARVNGVAADLTTYNDEASGGINVGTAAFCLVHTDTSALSGAKVFTLGADINQAVGTRQLDGYVAEVVVYNRVLSAAEIVQVETYLMNKWGVTTTGSGSGGSGGGSGGGSTTVLPYDPNGTIGTSWTLTFQDEFNGLTLDPAKWVDHYDWWSPPQTFSTTNIDVANGTLRAQPDVDGSGNMKYRTIHTRSKFSQLYGYFEARMKISKGRTFDAFWLYDNVSADEIDIIESYSGEDPAAEWGFGSGVNAYPSRYGSTIHKAGGGGANTVGPCKSVLAGPDLSADFHIYGCKWDASGCTFYLDGVPMDTGGENPQQATGNGRLNMALSNAMFLMFDFKPNFHAGAVDASNTTMGLTNACLVDYVRVWA